MILAFQTEREEGVITSTLTFEGTPKEYADLLNRVPGMMETAMQRAIEKMCVIYTEPDDA